MIAFEVSRVPGTFSRQGILCSYARALNAQLDSTVRGEAMRVLLFVWCLFLLARPVGVAQAAESFLVFPPGLDSCQVWTQGRIQTGVAQVARQAWVLGFVTAANAYTQTYGYGDGNLTKDTDAEGLYAWIDNFCIANPFNGLSSATTALTNDLLARN